MSLLSRVRLERYQDEDDPTLSWRQRFLVREEVASQEAYYWWESDYHSNPHWSVGRTVLWTHWGLGLDLQVDPAIYQQDENATSEAYLTVRLGPLTLWANRRCAPNRPNVFESWTAGTSSPSASDVVSLAGGATGGSTSDN